MPRHINSHRRSGAVGWGKERAGTVCRHKPQPIRRSRCGQRNSANLQKSVNLIECSPTAPARRSATNNKAMFLLNSFLLDRSFFVWYYVLDLSEKYQLSFPFLNCHGLFAPLPLSPSTSHTKLLMFKGFSFFFSSTSGGKQLVQYNTHYSTPAFRPMHVVN